MQAAVNGNSVAYVPDGEEAVGEEGISGYLIALVVPRRRNPVQHLQVELDEFFFVFIDKVLFLFLLLVRVYPNT